MKDIESREDKMKRLAAKQSDKPPVFIWNSIEKAIVKREKKRNLPYSGLF